MASATTCQFDQYWKSDCRLRISKLGDVSVKSKFDFCTAPPLLDMSVQVGPATVRLPNIGDEPRLANITVYAESAFDSSGYYFDVDRPLMSSFA